MKLHPLVFALTTIASFSAAGCTVSAAPTPASGVAYVGPQPPPSPNAHYVRGHWEHRGRVTLWVDGHWA